MKLVVFGLAVTSSWGNGHATLWRGLARALAARSHRVVFFERDQAFYAAHRDQPRPAGMQVILYRDWPAVAAQAEAELADADVAMATSYCPDAAPATALILRTTRPTRVFYDLDTPVTLAALARGERVPYLPPGGLAGFDLCLSYTGGTALVRLVRELGARRVAPLYGSVDPELHRPSAARDEWRGCLSYLGTYAADRQPALDRLFLSVADRLPEQRFFLAGAQYPGDFPWRRNVHFIPHLPPEDHPAFYASSPLTLNITRAPMAALGHCPSGRLFEAAACGVPVLTDAWSGIAGFFEPGSEILVARSSDEAVAALAQPAELLARIGERARARVLAQHTAHHRALELENLVS